jgi:hypothetical protein
MAEVNAPTVDSAMAELLKSAFQNGGKLDPLVAGAVADAIRGLTYAKSQFANICNQGVANELLLRGTATGSKLGLNPEQMRGLFPYPGPGGTAIDRSINLNPEPKQAAQPQPPIIVMPPAATPPPVAEKQPFSWLWPLLAALGLGLGGLGLGSYLSGGKTPAPTAPPVATDPWGGNVGMEIEG